MHHSHIKVATLKQKLIQTMKNKTLQMVVFRGLTSHLNLRSKAFAILHVRFRNPAIFWPGSSNMYKRHLVGLLLNHLATKMVRISRSTATVRDIHFVADH